MQSILKTVYIMSNNIYLKKGLDLPICGAAAQNTKKVIVPDVVAVKPTDFRGLVPSFWSERVTKYSQVHLYWQTRCLRTSFSHLR